MGYTRFCPTILYQYYTRGKIGKTALYAIPILYQIGKAKLKCKPTSKSYFTALIKHTHLVSTLSDLSIFLEKDMVSNITNKVNPSGAIQAEIEIIRSNSLSLNLFLHKVQNRWYSFGIVYSSFFKK